MKTKHRALALLMSAAMLASAVPAFAAETPTTHTIKEIYDGKSVNRPCDDGAKYEKEFPVGAYEELETITVTDGAESPVYTFETGPITDPVTETMPNGTVYTLSKMANSNNIKFAAEAVKEDISIEVVKTAAEFSLDAGSGTYGQNDNYGFTPGTCTVTTKDADPVVGGKEYSVVFTPNPGLDITHIRFRTLNAALDDKLVSVGTNSITVGGNAFTLTKGNNGSVTVKCASAVSDMMIVALTAPAKARYTLSVSTDSYVTSNVSSVTMTAGETRSINLDAASGHYVDTVTIHDGNATGTIDAYSSSVSVNGHTYSLSRNVSGDATLSVPAINANVSISVTSGSGRYYVRVSGNSDVSSNYDGLHYVRDTDDVEVILTPDDGVELTGFRITTDRGSATVDVDDTYFVIGGYTYRVSRRTSSDSLSIYLNPVPGNVEIVPMTKDNYHTITVRTDNGAECDDEGTVRVEDGDDLRLIFETLGDYEFKKITITRNGRTYTADPEDDEITVAGVDYPITYSASRGRLTIVLSEIDYNMTVKVDTDYATVNTGNRVITKKAGTGTTITLSTGTTVKAGTSTTITVKPTNYKKAPLTAVVLSTATDKATIYDATKTIKLDGKSYTVTQKTDGTWSVKVTVNKDLKITSSTDDKDIQIRDENFHLGYMEGVGGGYFMPDNTVSRAEAVTMLVRLFSGEDDKDLEDYDTDSYFYDVSEKAWYAPYIVWAEDEGYLDKLTNVGKYFRPTEPITRAEYLELVCAFKNVTSFTGYSMSYIDVAPDHWARRYIAYGANHGWVNGYTDHTFKPDNTIRRDEIAALTNRVMGRSVNSVAFTSGNYNLFFVDVPTSHWAYFQILEASNSHYVKSANSFGETWQ